MSAFAGAEPFLGRVDEICLVTRDRQRTAEALARLGVWPWRFMEINPDNTAEQTYRGKAAPFSIRVGFATVGETVFELMEPMDENSIFAEHLNSKGEGLHHVSFNLNGRPWNERIEAFKARGFEPVQSGLWMGAVRFAFFDTEAATGMSFETYQYPAGWTDPPDQARWWSPANQP